MVKTGRRTDLPAETPHGTEFYKALATVIVAVLIQLIEVDGVSHKKKGKFITVCV